MIIDRLRTIDANGERRVEARVWFEDGSPRDEVVFASVAGAARPAVDPNGFLLGGFLPAWLAGERRIVVEGAVCPLLVANLGIAASMLSGWYRDFPPLPLIEAERRHQAPVQGAAIFLSGGVDSLASLRHLTTVLPPGHPERPGAAVLVDYQDIRNVSRDETEARFIQRSARCRAVCEDIGVQLVTIRTNIRRLNDDPQTWIHRYHGAVLAAMGHFVSDDFCLLHVAATNEAAHLDPWGSHPLLDPFYSSRHLRIAHHGVEFSRLEKVGLLRDWSVALDTVNVCTSRESRGRNCGRCEKCIRTRLHLLVHGCLARAAAFAGEDVLPAELEKLRIGSVVMYSSWLDAVPMLRAIGRQDLLEVVERKIRQYHEARLPAADNSPPTPPPTKPPWYSPRAWKRGRLSNRPDGSRSR